MITEMQGARGIKLVLFGEGAGENISPSKYRWNPDMETFMHAVMHS